MSGKGGALAQGDGGIGPGQRRNAALAHRRQQRPGQHGLVRLCNGRLAQHDRAEPLPLPDFDTVVGGVVAGFGLCLQTVGKQVQHLCLGQGGGGQYARAGCRTLQVGDGEPFGLRQRRQRVEAQATAQCADPVLALGITAFGDAFGIGQCDQCADRQRGLGAAFACHLADPSGERLGRVGAAALVAAEAFVAAFQILALPAQPALLQQQRELCGGVRLSVRRRRAGPYGPVAAAAAGWRAFGHGA